MELSHQLHERTSTGRQIALTWVYDADTGTYAHNGATSGFTSYAFFNPRMDSAVVVLMNSGPNLLFSPDSIAEHIQQRLSGEPAISLDTVLVRVGGGFRGVLRSFGAYWLTMLAAGVFVYAAVLGAQGLAALVLPRRLFLRFSGSLQLAAVGLIVGVYFLQPGFGGLSDLNIGSIRRVVQWLPSYWLLALYQQLNGSMHPALAPLARRASMGLADVVCGAAVVYTFSYWRTLRQIVEEPDIAPGARRWRWLPRFGNQAQTAIGQFSLRTIARSRQHRLILGFYLGIGLAFTGLRLKGLGTGMSNPSRAESMQLWMASIMMMALAVLGTRVAFALPLDLRANWIFRVIGVRSGQQTLTASRRALLLLSVMPVWLVTAVVGWTLWPGPQNAGHLVVLGLFGMILADICLLRFRKIPFTCSWLPGKSHFNMALIGGLVLLSVGKDAVTIERNALWKTGSMTVMLSVLAVVWVCVRRTTVVTRREGQELRLEEEAPPELMGLGLYRDGVMPIETPQATRTP
jgi:hypothetical protein